MHNSLRMFYCLKVWHTLSGVRKIAFAYNLTDKIICKNNPSFPGVFLYRIAGITFRIEEELSLTEVLLTKTSLL